MSSVMNEMELGPRASEYNTKTSRRILQQRSTAWRVHGRLRDRFGNVPLHRRRNVVEVWLRPPRMILWV